MWDNRQYTVVVEADDEKCALAEAQETEWDEWDGLPCREPRYSPGEIQQVTNTYLRWVEEIGK